VTTAAAVPGARAEAPAPPPPGRPPPTVHQTASPATIPARQRQTPRPARRAPDVPGPRPGAAARRSALDTGLALEERHQHTPTFLTAGLSANGQAVLSARTARHPAGAIATRLRLGSGAVFSEPFPGSLRHDITSYLPGNAPARPARPGPTQLLSRRSPASASPGHFASWVALGAAGLVKRDNLTVIVAAATRPGPNQKMSADDGLGQSEPHTSRLPGDRRPKPHEEPREHAPATRAPAPVSSRPSGAAATTTGRVATAWWAFGADEVVQRLQQSGDLLLFLRR